MQVEKENLIFFLQFFILLNLILNLNELQQ